ncbi:MAG: cadmium-translocating P-type ATPase [Bacilli bacterium]|jgi:Cu+-exporting ATPase|nr:cadmium-translocating P-type ATPase [Bacilli bacterium]MCH4211047.1 cadmium-translocating P-type ATPase [Bacilli bacterium]MCH4228486.1 cadmium-translocating P-type ATPase [Bacilli bacterium]MCI2054917.1 cadmium-translocating P-type ATPase [Bacilli bacterium]
MEEKDYKINGMFCTACQGHVQKAALKTKGVKEAEVSLLTNSMHVVWEEKSNDKLLEKEIKAAGYVASPSINESFENKRKERKKELRKTLIKLVSAAILLLILMYFSMGMMWGWPSFSLIANYAIELALATLIIAIYYNYFIVGIKSLVQLHPNMLALVSIGSGVSYLYGLYVFIMICLGKQTSGEVYFEATGMILVLVSLGKYLEAIAKSKTTSSIENLLSLAPETALIEKDGQEVEVPVSSLKIGDIAIVKPGSRVPSDGRIKEGYGHLEEAAITGEAVPAFRKEGDEVIGSTLNTSGSFKMEITTVGKDTTINKIVHLVEEASNSKAKLSALADKVAAIFVPTVILIAIVVFLCWALIKHDIPLAINMGVSVLVVSCPCALGLATPVAVMVGTGKGAESGILIKSASAFEELSKVQAMVIDKTGTITTGHLHVNHVSLSLDAEKDAILSLESLSEHPLSEAICLEMADKGAKKGKVSLFEYLPGFGLKGEYAGHRYMIGNQELLNNEKIAVDDHESEEIKNEGASISYVAKDGSYIGFISLLDEIKEGAIDDIQSIQRKGVQLILASGDNEGSVTYLAERVGIKTFHGGVKPEGKLAIVKSLKEEGKIVAMVGDGVNDAPALEAADVGIAIGSGTDIAIDSADIILVNSSLHDLSSSLTLSHKVVNNIKLNLFWAFFYNVIGIPLAAGVFYYYPGWSLNPMIASAMMALSSVSVVLNALRLKWIKLEK